MTAQLGRPVGDVFTSTEKDLLELLCSGKGANAAAARAQLVSSRWGGYEFEDCGCFLIQSDSTSEGALTGHDGGPFASAEVGRNGEALGLLELWVVDGRLHSVNYLPFGEHHDSLPTVDAFDLTLIE